MSRITMSNNPNRPKITLDEGFEQFIKHCKIRNLREDTIKHYEGTMRSIYKFIEPKTIIKDINESTVDSFILYCQNELEVKDVTINTYLRGLRTVLYYFMRLGYMDEFKIATYKFDKTIIETYTDEELKKLLKKPNMQKCSFVQFRSWTICNFLIGTGCRVNSLINIKNKDIDFENAVVYLNVTKNRKPLIIPLSKSLVEILQTYMKIRGGELEDCLFCTDFGKTLDRQTVNLSINIYNKKRGVEKTGIHRFRHTFAKKWILYGGDVFKLQKILGHSSMAIVRMYVEMFTSDLKQNFDEINPLEQLQIQVNEKLRIKMRGK
ncbi:MAG: tyrosine-type recombinase/integrase [Clostridium neonatale]